MDARRTLYGVLCGLLGFASGYLAALFRRPKYRLPSHLSASVQDTADRIEAIRRKYHEQTD